MTPEEKAQIDKRLRKVKAACITGVAIFITACVAIWKIVQGQ